MTTIALLGLSVYMGVAFKDIAVIKMIKGRALRLRTISPRAWHQSVGATLGVSIMPLQLHLERLVALNLPWKHKHVRVCIRDQVHIPGPLLLAAEPAYPDEAKMRLALVGTCLVKSSICFWDMLHAVQLHRWQGSGDVNDPNSKFRRRRRGNWLRVLCAPRHERILLSQADRLIHAQAGPEDRKTPRVDRQGDHDDHRFRAGAACTACALQGYLSMFRPAS